MPRVARLVVPGLPHHITQRGNNRQDVFFTDDDRRFYLRTLHEQASRYRLAIIAYCLMTNHVHLVAVPRDGDSLARALGSTHLKYARYVNHLHGRSGHLWQNRFHSCALGPEHELASVRYAERNPVRARLVRAAWTYPWSSAAAHCGGGDASALLDLRAWRRRYDHADWKNILRAPDDDDDRIMAHELRRRTLGGRPLGSDRFIARLEAALGRRLRPPPMGRPRARAKRTPG